MNNDTFVFSKKCRLNIQQIPEENWYNKVLYK